MTYPKIGDWIVKSIDANDPEPYLNDPDYEEAIWAHTQDGAHPFTSAAAAHEARHKIGGESLRVFRLVPRKWLPWSEAHVKAAKIECYRWAASEMETGREERAEAMVTIGRFYLASENVFLTELAALLPTQQEIDCFRRRIENRASGRVEVKEEAFFRIRLRDGLYVPERGDDETAGVEARDARRRENGGHLDQTAARIAGARVVEVKLNRRRTIGKAIPS